MRDANKPSIRWDWVLRDGVFWGGVSLALVGYLLENLGDGRQAYDLFLLFGGLFIGFSAARNMNAPEEAEAS